MFIKLMDLIAWCADDVKKHALRMPLKQQKGYRTQKIINKSPVKTGEDFNICLCNLKNFESEDSVLLVNK